MAWGLVRGRGVVDLFAGDRWDVPLRKPRQTEFSKSFCVVSHGAGVVVPDGACGDDRREVRSGGFSKTCGMTFG